MSKIIQEDGVDVEVFSAEEIETQKQEAIEQYKADNPDKTEELTQLQEDLRAKEEELAGLKDKDKNFGNLRKQKEAAEEKINKIQTDIDAKIESVKREVMEGVMKDHYNDTLKSLAGDDEELAKKIELQYKRLADTASTKQEIVNKLRDAWVLSTKPEGVDAFNSTVISSGGVGRLNFKNSAPKLNTDEKMLGSKFGLSESDIKKYIN